MIFTQPRFENAAFSLKQEAAGIQEALPDQVEEGSFPEVSRHQYAMPCKRTVGQSFSLLADL